MQLILSVLTNLLYHINCFRLKKIQDKKKIAKKKAEAAKAEKAALGLMVEHDPNTMLDEGDEDLLF